MSISIVPPDSSNTKIQSIPSFLVKLYNLVSDKASNELICWSDCGNSFLILDGNLLAKNVLPFYFKHNNLASFIRQLNMYGFHKTNTLEVLKGDSAVTEFSHPSFQRDRPNLMVSISRRTGGGTGMGSNMPLDRQLKSGDMMNVLTLVNKLGSKQSTTEQQLQQLREENHQLWLELRYLRQQHRQQQQAVRHLINFFSYAFRNRNISPVGGGYSMKRKPPMAIESIDPNVDNAVLNDGLMPAKVQKVVEPTANSVTIEEINSPAEDPEFFDFLQDLPVASTSSSSNLPFQQNLNTPNTDILNTSSPILETSTDANLGQTSYPSLPPSPELSKDLLNGAVDSTSNDLQDIKELLEQDGSFDSDTLMRIFNFDKPFSLDESLFNNNPLLLDEEDNNILEDGTICSTLPTAENALVTYDSAARQPGAYLTRSLSRQASAAANSSAQWTPSSSVS